jgi:hypothetical protein
MAPLPDRIRIGHLTYTVSADDAAVREHGVRNQGNYSGWSSAVRQVIALATVSTNDGNAPFGPDYRRETLLHEVIHSCLRAAACDPDEDAKAGVGDVEERAVAAMSGPLLAALRDNPALTDYLLAKGS